MFHTLEKSAGTYYSEFKWGRNSRWVLLKQTKVEEEEPDWSQRFRSSRYTLLGASEVKEMG